MNQIIPDRDQNYHFQALSGKWQGKQAAKNINSQPKSITF